MSRKRDIHAAFFRQILANLSPEEKTRALECFQRVVAEEKGRKEMETLEREEIPSIRREFEEKRKRAKKMKNEMNAAQDACIEARRRLDEANLRLTKMRSEIGEDSLPPEEIFPRVRPVLEDSPEISEEYIPPNAQDLQACDSPSVEGFSEEVESVLEPFFNRQATPECIDGDTTEPEEPEEPELHLLQIPTYTFRGAFCFHCGAHDASLMAKNNKEDWETFIRGKRGSRLWLAARKRLTFLSSCKCTCTKCEMTAEYCMCKESFMPLSTCSIHTCDYMPKGFRSGKFTYVSKPIKETGILNGSLYDAFVAINKAARAGNAEEYHRWFEAIRPIWKRYVIHINSEASMETYVYLAYRYSCLCPNDTYCAFMYCDFGEKGSKGRNHCSSHRTQIMGKAMSKCDWMKRGKKRFDDWKINQGESA